MHFSVFQCMYKCARYSVQNGSRTRLWNSCVYAQQIIRSSSYRGVHLCSAQYIYFWSYSANACFSFDDTAVILRGRFSAPNVRTRALFFVVPPSVGCRMPVHHSARLFYSYLVRFTMVPDMIELGSECRLEGTETTRATKTNKTKGRIKYKTGRGCRAI